MKWRIRVHLTLAVLLCLVGLLLLFIGFFVPPVGEIDSSVLISYGEVSTFAGSLLGIDYRYRYKYGGYGKESDP